MHYDDPAGLGKHLRETTAGLAPDSVATLVFTLADVLESVGRSDAAVALLEGRLGLTDADYDDPAGLDTHLRETTDGLAPDNVASLVQALADALGFVGRSDAAVALLEGRLGLTDADYDDPAGLGRHLQETTVGLAPTTRRISCKPWPRCRNSWVGRAVARRYANGRLGLTDADYDDPAGLGNHLWETTHGLGPDNASCLVDTLAAALQGTGRTGESADLLDAYLTTFRPLDDMAPGPALRILFCY